MPDEIACCYSGCSRTVWAPMPTGMGVVCTSATCMNCRRMVFCLEHFSELYQGQARYACPHCDGVSWWVAVFEGDSIGQELTGAIDRQGGAIEHRAAPSPSTEVPQTPQRTPPDIKADWELLTTSELPPGFSLIGPAVFKRPHLDGVDIIARTARFRAVANGRNYTRGACSPTGHRVALLSQTSGEHVIECHDRSSSHPLEVLLPARHRATGIYFIDEIRFIYLVQDKNGASVLFEGLFDGTRRIRSRRILSLGDMPAGPGLLAVANRRRTVLTVSKVSSTFELISIDLADSRVRTLAGLTHPPRQLVAAEDGEIFAFITLDGEIRFATFGERHRLIGRTDENLLSMNHSGTHLAWINARRLEVADLSAGELSQTTAPSDTIQLSPARR